MSTEAQRAYAREYYARNRERIKAQVRAYHRANKAECNQRSRDYYYANRERILAIRSSPAGREVSERYEASTKGIVRRARRELVRATQRLESL